MYEVSNEYMEAVRIGVQKSHIRGMIGSTAFSEGDIRRGTLSIYNQSSASSDVTLGSVYIGTLECTLLYSLNIPQLQGQYITVESGIEIDDKGTTEYVPAPSGRYKIDSAQRTKYGINITAYDDMQLFDKRFSVTDLTPATPFVLLQYVCNQCGVQLGMSNLSGFPNANRTLKLYPDHDIETYRDLLYWIAQTVGAFATMDRQGKLVLRKHSGNAVDTIDSNNRYNSSSFGHFHTKYTGLSVVDLEQEKTKYYGAAVDDGTVINLGSNPFLQTADQEAMVREILAEVQNIQYVPFETQIKAGLHYDLGDVLQNINGIAGNNSLCCVMSYEYNHGRSYTLEGYGADPMLATGRSKSDKNIAGLLNKVKSEEFIIHSYVNADEIEIEDQSTATIVDIAYGTNKSTTISFYAEIQLEVETIEDETLGFQDAVAKVTYIDRGESFTCQPTFTYLDGDYVLHLIQKFDVDAGMIGIFSVMLTADGGNFTIPAGCGKAWLEGTGLVTEEEWDGILRMSDFWTSPALLEDIGVQSYGDGIQSGMYIPIGGSFDETMEDTLLGNDIDVYNYVESMEVEDE